MVRRPKLAHTTASRRRLEGTATVMPSRAPAVDADVLAARPSEDTHGCSGPPEPSSTLPAWSIPLWKRPVRTDCGKLSAVGRGEDEEAK